MLTFHSALNNWLDQHITMCTGADVSDSDHDIHSTSCWSGTRNDLHFTHRELLSLDENFCSCVLSELDELLKPLGFEPGEVEFLNDILAEYKLLNDQPLSWDALSLSWDTVRVQDYIKKFNLEPQLRAALHRAENFKRAYQQRFGLLSLELAAHAAAEGSWSAAVEMFNYDSKWLPCSYAAIENLTCVDVIDAYRQRHYSYLEINLDAAWWPTAARGLALYVGPAFVSTGPLRYAFEKFKLTDFDAYLIPDSLTSLIERTGRSERLALIDSFDSEKLAAALVFLSDTVTLSDALDLVDLLD